MAVKLKTNGDWLRTEPFTLLLSAGFFGFFAHAGLLAALEDAGLVPQRIVGVSAGALAGGLWAAGKSANVLERELKGMKRQDFWDPGFPWGGFLKGQKYDRILQNILGAPQDARDCAIPFTGIAFDLLRWRSVALESGPLVKVIRASCALPLMFRPVRLDRMLLVDGGVADDFGFSAVGAGERIFLHYLPGNMPWAKIHKPKTKPPPQSQVNVLVAEDLPRVTPFHLERGYVAFDLIRGVARSWLDKPVAECGNMSVLP